MIKVSAVNSGQEKTTYEKMPVKVGDHRRKGRRPSRERQGLTLMKSLSEAFTPSRTVRQTPHGVRVARPP